MILSKKSILMQSEFSMCLAYLLNFEDPDDPSSLIISAINLKKKYFNRLKI
jgi:hypothetical protein